MKKTAYQRHIGRLIEFLEGDGEGVRRHLEKDMQEAAKKLEFEEAGRIKDTLFSLDHIQDAHLLHRESAAGGTRIEAYDVAHISGSDRVGVMVVLTDGVPNKSEYKKFKLTKDKNDDLEGLKEILTRRFTHSEWQLPDVIVLDGDERYMRVAGRVLDEFYKSNLLENKSETSTPAEGLAESALTDNIHIVAVTKDGRHKAKKIIGPKDIVDTMSKDIVLINSEAHRFSLRYHRELRSKKFQIKKK